MIPRGSLRRALFGIAAAVALLGPVVAARAATSAPSPAPNNDKTLTIALPGPFSGCTFLDPGVTPTATAMLDLLRPSAFLTNPNGVVVGAGGSIGSAELTSLQPETVVYTLRPHVTWSNGQVFNGGDLKAWWEHARTLDSVQSDGYRALSSLAVSRSGLTVTAIFRRPYADWNLLFRDVEARNAPTGCSLAKLVRRPSIGPYFVAAASPQRIVLRMNRHWPLERFRFGRLVLVANGPIPSNARTSFVSYSLIVNRAQEQTLSAHPSLLSYFGNSTAIEQIRFAPRRPLTRSLAIREALSWSLNRQSIINQLWGSVTFSPSVGASAVFAQGQSNYPGSNGSGPTAQLTTTTANPASNSATPTLSDCSACARDVLEAAKFHRTMTGWRTAKGALLLVRLAVGPSEVDRATALIVARQWRRAGFGVKEMHTPSDFRAAADVVRGGVDAAVLSRAVETTPGFAARSWSGPPYLDTFLSGYRTRSTNVLFNQAMANFNPVTASATWLAFDQAIMTSFWVRPLFTPPSLMEWSNNLVGVTGASSVPGFMDQVPNWTTVVPLPK